nr:uncharacterized protein LOC129380305 [Dermacentor andersoni]
MPDDASQTYPRVSPVIVCAGAERQRDPNIFSSIDEKEVEERLESLEEVLQCLTDDGLELNLKRCCFGATTPRKGEQAEEPSGHTSDAAVLQAKVPTITAEPRSSADSQRNAALPNHGPDDHAGHRATGDEAPMSPRAHRGGGGRSKHGGKSAAGKDAGPRGPSKRRSKMADSRLVSPEGAQDAEELKSSEAVQSPVSPEGARAGEMPLSPGALLSAEYGSSAVASPGERTQLHDHTTGESHSHRRGRKGAGKKHLRGHKKESHNSAEASSKPGGNTQGILKASSPEDAVKASSPPPSSGNLQVEAPQSALFSPTESAIKRASPPTETEDKASGVMGRRTLVIQEDASFLAASKEGDPPHRPPAPAQTTHSEAGTEPSSPPVVAAHAAPPAAKQAMPSLELASLKASAHEGRSEKSADVQSARPSSASDESDGQQESYSNKGRFAVRFLRPQGSSQSAGTRRGYRRSQLWN